MDDTQDAVSDNAAADDRAYRYLKHDHFWRQRECLRSRDLSNSEIVCRSVLVVASAALLFAAIPSEGVTALKAAHPVLSRATLVLLLLSLVCNFAESCVSDWLIVFRENELDRMFTDSAVPSEPLAGASTLRVWLYYGMIGLFFAACAVACWMGLA